MKRKLKEEKNGQEPNKSKREKSPEPPPSYEDLEFLLQQNIKDNPVLTPSLPQPHRTLSKKHGTEAVLEALTDQQWFTHPTDDSLAFCQYREISPCIKTVQIRLSKLFKEINPIQEPSLEIKNRDERDKCVAIMPVTHIASLFKRAGKKMDLKEPSTELAILFGVKNSPSNPDSSEISSPSPLTNHPFYSFGDLPFSAFSEQQEDSKYWQMRVEQNTPPSSPEPHKGNYMERYSNEKLGHQHKL